MFVRNMKVLEAIEAALLLKKYADGKIKAIELLKLKENRLYLAGMDACIQPVRDFGLLIKGLVKIHGPAVLTTMKMAYKEAGIATMREIKKILPREKWGKILQLWIELGYVGQLIEVKVGRDESLREIPSLEGAFLYIKDNDNKICVKVKNTFSCRAIKSVMKKTAFPVCIYEPSYTAGVIEAALGRKCEVEEMKCEAKGDKYCEWVFTLE
jgi:predicted hydrocarbon binding protein